MARAPSSPHVLAVARGDEPADLLLRRGRVLSPSTREWVTTDLAIADGVVAGWGPREAVEEVALDEGNHRTLSHELAVTGREVVDHRHRRAAVGQLLQAPGYAEACLAFSASMSKRAWAAASRAIGTRKGEQLT